MIYKNVILDSICSDSTTIAQIAVEILLRFHLKSKRLKRIAGKSSLINNQE